MDKRKWLMGILLAMSVYMAITVFRTSLESNLFKEWSALAAIPWMGATIKDFYQNLFLMWLWVLYKEDALWKALLWAVAFIMLGSIITPLYLFIQLWKLKPGDKLERVLLRS